MTFNEAIAIIAKTLSNAGTNIDVDNYDGAIIKKLAASNTLDAGRTTNQTHIAITGAQMDIFPYLCADGYFYEENRVADVDLKKYFVIRIPITLYESNLKYLGYDGYELTFTEGVLQTTTAVVRSKRGGQADQLQVSMLDMDGEQFVSFRRLMHEGTYFVLLKRKSAMQYDAFGINTTLLPEDATEFTQLNNKFFKNSTNTVVDAGVFNSINKEIVTDPVPQNLSVEELGKILRKMYDDAIGGKVSATHMFGLKYGQVIQEKNYSVAEIIRHSGINDSYNVEVSKGIGIYKSIKDNEYGIRFADEDEARETAEEKESIPYAWYVGATGTDADGNWKDFSDQFISEGRWENGWDDKFVDVVNKMEVGDRIAIKAAYTKKKGVPFNNNGQVVGVMAIKAIGTITENPKDGKNIKVQWIRVEPVKEWYGSGVLRTTVHYVAAEEGYIKKALLDFTFNNVPQDYSVCEEKYMDEDSTIVEDPLNMPIFCPRTDKIHPLNCILYGAPGTGKTYATAEYALAIIENREVDEAPKTAEERKAVMEKYRTYINDGKIVFTTFHQSYGYEDFIQGLRPVTTDGVMEFLPIDGVFKRIVTKAMNHPEENFVIIIDEINRANISKVFGELITLIEDDKRWGEVNALQVVLPSGDPFTIPNNLYIVGTMNSADKSISLIDTALRRRFEFIEVVPNATLIADPVLRSVLEKLNASLVKELDSTDLLVGHAYFIGKAEKDLCGILNRSIVPLLYEYFYDNSTKVKAQIKNALPNDQYEILGGTVGRIKVVRK